MKKINPLDEKLTIVDDQGNEILCQILFTFESEEFGKNYVVFYPLEDENEDDDSVTVMAASYTEGENGAGDLCEVTTDEEWSLIEDVLGQYEDSMEEDHECCCGDDDCCCCDDDDDECEEGCCCHHHDEEE